MACESWAHTILIGGHGDEVRRHIVNCVIGESDGTLTTTRLADKVNAVPSGFLFHHFAGWMGTRRLIANLDWRCTEVEVSMELPDPSACRNCRSRLASLEWRVWVRQSLWTSRRMCLLREKAARECPGTYRGLGG